MSVGPVPDEAAAVAIFKSKCPYPSRADFGPYDRWEAELVGRHWHVHARTQIIYSGKVPDWLDGYLDVPNDNSTPIGHCTERVTQ